MNIKPKTLLFLLLSLIISAIVIISLYSEVNSLGGLKLEYSPDSLEVHSHEVLRDLNIKTEDKTVEINLNQNSGLIRQLQDKFGIAKSNELLRDSVYGYYWKVTYVKPDKLNITVGENSSEGSVEGTGTITLNYSTEGRILDFTREIDDSLNLPSLTDEAAKKLSEDFLNKYSWAVVLNDSVSTIQSTANQNNSTLKLKFNSQTKTERKNRTDFKFIYNTTDPLTGDKITATVSIAGNLISNFSTNYEVPEIYNHQPSDFLHSFGVIIFIVVITVLMLITLFKRIRAYEIGFRIAKWAAIIFALSFMGKLMMQSNIVLSDWQIILSLVFGAIFLGGIGLMAWAIGETIVREYWKDKFITIDLFTKGHYFHSRLGDSIVKGIMFGSIGTAFWILLLYVAEITIHFQIVPKKDDALYLFSAFSPALSLIDELILSYALITVTVFLYVIPSLRKVIRNNYLLIIAGGIVLGFINSNSISPDYIGIIIGIIFGIYLTAVYFRTDFLTIIITVFVFYAILDGYCLFTTGNSFYMSSGYILAGIFVLLLVYGISSFLSKDKSVDLEAITPVFAKNITERERMQRELEIARDVQMSFLPHNPPNFPGFEIASSCEPALEVGGDYYDFVPINENKLGIIIGDVSGKGTQAAFYMTLTKGFLKAVSKTSDSPSEILRMMNELFYENVERGTFISMVYGIFDNKERKIKIARAGHNPVIMRDTVHGSAEFISTKGLALGLEKGVIFNKTISEVELDIKENDTFVFYTDGFTEAMNKQRDEFGEARLKEIVEKNSSNPAEKILEKIFSEVKKFRGRAQQTDDMTIVVVKVL